MTASTKSCFGGVGDVMSASPSPSSDAGIPKSISVGTTCPGKITAVFGDITISSNFDSGNLAKAEECKSAEGPDTREFDLWTSRDCAETEFENGNKTWFYFSVTTPSNFSDKLLRFNIRNLNKQSKLYQQGLTPITKTVPGRGGWERLRGRVDYENVEEGMRISFQFAVSDSRKLTTYFAFCYPYSYSECQRRLARLDEQFRQPLTPEAHDDIYYHRELVCRSLEGRRIDLITVTSYQGISEEREPRLPCLFPDEESDRCYVFKNKRVIFVSSRVHPGETPSSFVFNGLLQFLLRRTDPRAIAVRKKFVFKLVPMLNPDGVYRGHYRTDTRGANLNRYYLNPDPTLHPSIYAARSLIVHYHCQNQCSNVTSRNRSRKMNNNLHVSSIPCMGTRSLHLPCAGDGTLRDSPVPHRLSLSSPHTPLANFPGSKSLPPCMYVEQTNRTSNISSKSLLHQSLGAPSHKTLPPACKTLTNEASAEGSCDFIKTSQESGLALYIDLHAHASKRGVFMYGNHFSDVSEAAENMLFPRLLSLNSPHLDFDYCVFTERNMYLADRREGTSKEGSGRVAMHKATGIIPCYTLECNYNSGRQCNPITEATMDDGRASPPFSSSPMTHRFSIADFEQVGRAIAISVLDLYQMNPWSRLPTTSFASLAGVKQNLIHRINSMRAKKAVVPKEDGVTCNVSAHTVATAASGKICSPTSLVPAPAIPSKQSLPGISRRTGRVADVSHLLEAKQRRSAMFRGNHHVRSSVVMSSSKSASRRAEQGKMTFGMQSMKSSPASVIFPSPLTKSEPRRVETTSSHITEARITSIHKKSLRSTRVIAPLTKGSADGSNTIQASSTLRGGQNARSSIFIPDPHHQHNHIPSLKYFTSKGPLLKIPVHTDQVKCRNSNEQGLSNKKLSSLDSTLSADRVIPTSASH